MLYLWVSVCVCAEDIQASFIQKFDPTYIHSCWAVIVFVLNLCGFEVFDCTLHKRTVFLSLRKWTCLHVPARCLADIVSAELQGCLPYSFLKLFFFWPQTQLSFSARSKVIHRETDHHDPCVLQRIPPVSPCIYTHRTEQLLQEFAAGSALLVPVARSVISGPRGSVRPCAYEWIWMFLLICLRVWTQKGHII